MTRASWRWLGGLALLVALLALENWLVFRDHWRGRLTFPFDFSMTYHAVPFAWQAAVRARAFSEWMPFQGFGFPLGIGLQTGLFYPPYWAYPLIPVTYSLKAATLLQCAHVAAGGLGASLLARVRGFSFAWVVVAGVAYQLFGGFFSNAEHVDIVRGYAFAPWLIACLLPDGAPAGRLPGRAWATPLVVLLFVTGAYPGQWLGGLFLGGVLVVAQVLDADDRRAGLIGAGKRLGLLALGLAVAAVQLVPSVVGRGLFQRTDAATTLDYQGLTLDHYLAVPFRYDFGQLALDPSMRSVYLALPVVAGLCFLAWSDVRRQRALALVLCVALLLAAGARAHALLRAVVPPLGLSRFPSSDYRAWIAAPALILGLAGLRTLLAVRGRWLRLALGLLLFDGLLAYAARRIGWDILPAGQRQALIAVVVAVHLVALLGRRVPAPVAIGALAVIVFADGWRLHHAWTDMWRAPMPGADYRAARRRLVDRLRHPLAARPARGDAQNLDGYLLGQYLSFDYAMTEHLRPARALMADQGLLGWVLGPADPRVLAAPVAPAAVPATPSVASARQILYDGDHVRYRVTTTAPGILVENEPAYPGWSAALCDAGTPLAAEPALWPLRAWRLPAVDAEVCLRYRTPGLRLGLGVSAAALVLWALAALIRARRARR